MKEEFNVTNLVEEQGDKLKDGVSTIAMKYKSPIPVYARPGNAARLIIMQRECASISK